MRALSDILLKASAYLQPELKSVISSTQGLNIRQVFDTYLLRQLVF